jgi:hypothetical protein
LTDERSRKERDAYAALATAYRKIAEDLQATAAQMAAYRKLPMGRHDEKAMSDPKLLRAFERFVTLEQDLLDVLQSRVERDRKMLVESGQ